MHHPIAVHRCDHISGGAYVVVCDLLARSYPAVPQYWTDRNEFLLDIGWRGVNVGTMWAAVGEASACDDPEIASKLAELRELTPLWVKGR